MSVQIWLPFPPSVNNLFPTNRMGRRFPSKAYKAWQKHAYPLLMAERLKTFTAPVIVKIELFPRDSRPRDADNYGKAILDALVKCRVLHDDNNQWVKAVVPFWREPNTKNPGVIVHIRPAEGEFPRLNAAERKTLERIKRNGVYLVGPNYKPTLSIQGLLEKGVIVQLPGLLEDAPQGFAEAV